MGAQSLAICPRPNSLRVDGWSPSPPCQVKEAERLLANGRSPFEDSERDVDALSDPGMGTLSAPLPPADLPLVMSELRCQLGLGQPKPTPER